MNGRANYATQQTIWSVQIGKNLTDRTIRKYQKLGFYSNGFARAEVVEKKRTKQKQDLYRLFDL